MTTRAPTTYLPHFGLTSEPFSNAPVTRFYFESEQHQQALVRLNYALSSMKGLAVVIGDIGNGKTTLARRLLDSLPDNEFEAALLVIIHSGVDASWLLRRIAMQLGVAEPANEKLALLSQLYQRLVQIYESGKKAVVLIDEAQMLATRELMEEFRGLLNLEVPERKLISFVFFGLPDIDEMMNLDPPLKQRVALKFKLEGMTVEGTTEYVDYRLKQAGATKNMFTPLAIRVVHRAAHGTPRVINTLCDNLLLEAFLSGQHEISGDLAEKVARQLDLFSDAPVEGAKAELSGGALSPAKTAPVAKPAVVTPKPVAAPIAAKPVTPLAPRPAVVAAKPSVAPVVADIDPIMHEPAAITPIVPKVEKPAPEAWHAGPASTALPKVAAAPATAPTAASRPLATVQLTKVPASQARPAISEVNVEIKPDPAIIAAAVMAPEPVAPPSTLPSGAGATAPKTTVNLDEIDSLLASIRKN